MCATHSLRADARRLDLLRGKDADKGRRAVKATLPLVGVAVGRIAIQSGTHSELGVRKFRGNALRKFGCILVPIGQNPLGRSLVHRHGRKAAEERAFKDRRI